VFITFGEKTAKFLSKSFIEDGLKSKSINSTETIPDNCEILQFEPGKVSKTGLSRFVGYKIGVIQKIKVKGNNCAR